MIAPGRAFEPVGPVLDVALLHVHEARPSQLPRHKPKVNGPGADLAGQVEAVGRNVKQFQPGDEVFGDIAACGFGGFAEYVSFLKMH